MRRTSVSLLAALAALLAVSAAAHAYSMRLEPGGSISATSSSLTFEASGITIVCPVTLSGTLSRESIEVLANRQLGSVTGVSIGSCTGGSVSAVLNLNWSITVNSSLGPLPNELTGLLVNLTNVSFNLSVFGGFVNCLYRGTGGALVPLTTGREMTTGVYTLGTMRALSTVSIPLSRGGFGCPVSGHFAGSLTLSSTQRAAVSPHEFTIGPGGWAEGPITIGSGEEAGETCEMAVDFAFSEGAIPVTNGASVGSVAEATMECAAEGGGMKTTFFFLLPGTAETSQLLRDLAEILGRYTIGVKRIRPNGEECLFRLEALLLLGSTVYEVLSATLGTLVPERSRAECPRRIWFTGDYTPNARQTISPR